MTDTRIEKRKIYASESTSIIKNVLARALTDEDFKAEFITDAEGLLKREGLYDKLGPAVVAGLQKIRDDDFQKFTLGDLEKIADSYNLTVASSITVSGSRAFQRQTQE